MRLPVKFSWVPKAYNGRKWFLLIDWLLVDTLAISAKRKRGLAVYLNTQNSTHPSPHPSPTKGSGTFKTGECFESLTHNTLAYMASFPWQAVQIFGNQIISTSSGIRNTLRIAFSGSPKLKFKLCSLCLNSVFRSNHAHN